MFIILRYYDNVDQELLKSIETAFVESGNDSSDDNPSSDSDSDSISGQSDDETATGEAPSVTPR